MLPSRIKRRRKGYLEPSGSRWLAARYTRTEPYYAYDALGRPYSRDTEYPQKEAQHTASFSYNPSSEFTNAQLDEASYAYDNIGKVANGCKADWTSASRHEPHRDEATMRCRRINRRLSFGGADYAVYTANELNQYTKIDTNGSDFTPEYDADGDVEQSFRGSGGGLDTSQEVPEGRTANGVAVSQPIQWSSEYHDDELGLVYYNFRYYNTIEGKWLRRDPIGIKGGNNLYQYCKNATSLYLDVLGEMYIEDMNFVLNKYCSPRKCYKSCSEICQGKERTRRAENGCCEYRTKEPNEAYKPKANGCGSSWNQYLVPDSFPILSLWPIFSFEDACNKHDLCYLKCGANKKTCDSEFFANMRKECHRIIYDNGWVFVAVYIDCYRLANVYYGFVDTFGEVPFEDAQDEACLWKKCK